MIGSRVVSRHESDSPLDSIKKRSTLPATNFRLSLTPHLLKPLPPATISLSPSLPQATAAEAKVKKRGVEEQRRRSHTDGDQAAMQEPEPTDSSEASEEATVSDQSIKTPEEGYPRRVRNSTRRQEFVYG